MLVWLVEAGQEGQINACGPEPVTNSHLMAALRERFGRPPVPPAPAFVIKAATAAMGKEATVVLVSQRAVPTLALAQGFEFKFPTLDSALDDLLG
jgi:NAD dependent epimerase/dehydratase family enzyme